MFTMEQVISEFKEMNTLINKKLNGKQVKECNLDDVFNSIDEVTLFECLSLEEDDKELTSIHFIIGRVAVSEDEQNHDIFPTLTVQKRDEEGGLIIEEDYCPEGVNAEEDMKNCFIPFFERLKRHENQMELYMLTIG